MTNHNSYQNIEQWIYEVTPFLTDSYHYLPKTNKQCSTGSISSFDIQTLILGTKSDVAAAANLSKTKFNTTHL